MTTNEQQEFNVLSIFIENKIRKFSSMTFPKELTDALGSGALAIVRNMIRDGTVTDLEINFEYEFNETGITKYNILKKKKRSETKNNIAFWIIFCCTLLTAGDVVFKWIFKGSDAKTEEVGKSKKVQLQTKQSQIQTIKLVLS